MNSVELIKKDVLRVAHEANRNPDEIKIVAVTKYVSAQSALSFVLNSEITDIAENRADKFIEKKSFFSENNVNVNWHFIGNLQKRKVKSVINEIDYFHSLDSLSLANEINKRLTHPLKCFVEVNVSGEETKHGISVSELTDFVLECEKFENIILVGLMTMAPIDADETTQKNIFETLRIERDKLKARNIKSAPMTELSMGMSRDYEMAIRCGATFVRIGHALTDEM